MRMKPEFAPYRIPAMHGSASDMPNQKAIKEPVLAAQLTGKQSQSSNITRSSKTRAGVVKVFQATNSRIANAASETNISNRSTFTAFNFHQVSKVSATRTSHGNNLSLRVSSEGPSATSAQRYQWLRGMKKKGLTRDNCFRREKGCVVYS